MAAAVGPIGYADAAADDSPAMGSILQSVAAQVGQLPLHGVVHEMNEAGQRVIDAAIRAAQDHGSSLPLHGQRVVAPFARGALVGHGVAFFGYSVVGIPVGTQALSMSYASALQGCGRSDRLTRACIWAKKGMDEPTPLLPIRQGHSSTGQGWSPSPVE